MTTMPTRAPRLTAHALGIDPACLTADVTNHASRRIIEHHSGRLDATYPWEGTQRVRSLLPTSR